MRDVQGPQFDTQTRGAQVDMQTEGPKLNCYAKHGGIDILGGKYENHERPQM